MQRPPPQWPETAPDREWNPFPDHEGPQPPPPPPHVWATISARRTAVLDYLKKHPEEPAVLAFLAYYPELAS